MAMKIRVILPEWQGFLCFYSIAKQYVEQKLGAIKLIKFITMEISSLTIN